MVRLQKYVWAVIFGIALWVHPTQAQQKESQTNSPVAPDQPLTLGQSSSAPGGASTVANATDAKAPQPPDTRPLSGAERFTLGSAGTGRGYLISHVHLSQVADTNNAATTQGSELDTATQVSGSVAYQHLWSHSQLTTTFAGGGAVYKDRPNQNNAFQQLSITQMTTWRRWGFLLSGQASYFPESSFGYAGTFNPLGNLGSGFRLTPGSPNYQPAQLNPLFQPNQTVFTGRDRRISNVAVGQVQYNFSPRSSFTATGSYGMLTFVSQDFIDNNSITFRTGYNYALNRHDSIAVIYGFSRFRFSGADNKLDAQNAQIAYGRRVTGRLALQLFAGPQFHRLRSPGVGSNTQLAGSIGASVLYQLPRTAFDISYFRGITGGAGIFEGAESDLVQTTVTRQFSRLWVGSLSGGYARNQSLQKSTTGSQEFRFNSWHANATLNRAAGRHIRWFLTYNLQRQTSNNPLCIGVGCGRVYLRHQFGLGFDWDFSRIRRVK